MTTVKEEPHEPSDLKGTVYLSKDGWRWHVRHRRNGNIIAESGEGYQRLSHANAMARKLHPGVEFRVTERIPNES